MKQTNFSKDPIYQSHTKRTNLKRPIAIKEIESVNKLPKQKAPRPDGFIAEFYQIVMEEMIPVLYNLSQKTEVEEYF